MKYHEQVQMARVLVGDEAIAFTATDGRQATEQFDAAIANIVGREAAALTITLDGFKRGLETKTRSHAMAKELALRAARERNRFRAWVRWHRDQKGSNRCHLDDDKLYFEVLGEGSDPYVGALPPDKDMAKDCARYVLQRQHPDVHGAFRLPDNMTIDELTQEVVRLREEARRWYHADGSFELLDTAEEVVRRRVAAAARLEGPDPPGMPESPLLAYYPECEDGPCVRGTMVPARAVVRMVIRGVSPRRVAERFGIACDDVRACMAWQVSAGHCPPAPPACEKGGAV